MIFLWRWLYKYHKAEVVNVLKQNKKQLHNIIFSWLSNDKSDTYWYEDLKKHQPYSDQASKNSIGLNTSWHKVTEI